MSKILKVRHATIKAFRDHYYDRDYVEVCQSCCNIHKGLVLKKSLNKSCKMEVWKKLKTTQAQTCPQFVPIFQY